jgi:hypothetical protein
MTTARSRVRSAHFTGRAIDVASEIGRLLSDGDSVLLDCRAIPSGFKRVGGGCIVRSALAATRARRAGACLIVPGCTSGRSASRTC